MTSTVSKSKHNAPGQYLGYSLQPVRMFFHLLNAPKGARVLLEHFDDVAVHYFDGNVLLEQTKSALSHNPLSDWSLDLWKTISNWIDDITAERVHIESTRFHIYVTPSYEGDLSSEISLARTPAEVDLLVAKLSEKVEKKPPAKSCLTYIDKFLNFNPAIRREFVRRIDITSTDNDPVEVLRSLLAPSVSDKQIDLMCEAGIGMAKEQADGMLRKKLSAILEVDEFRRKFHSFVRKNNMENYLNSLNVFPAKDEVSCLVSCDHIPRRSWPLFRAKAMLSSLIAGFSSPGIQSHQEQLAA